MKSLITIFILSQVVFANEVRPLSMPKECDWQFAPLITQLEQSMPLEKRSEISRWSADDLLLGKGLSYLSTLVVDPKCDEVNVAPKKVIVEYSQILIPVSYSEFQKVIPADRWGTKLAHYLPKNSSVALFKSDSQGRPVAQIERMVLSALPFDLDVALLNQDMTKAELIQYGADSAKVLWRVYASDNGTTESDIGSVTFQSAANGTATLVTFHSAHKLRVLKLPAPRWAVRTNLVQAFLDHLRHYQELQYEYSKNSALAHLPR